MLWVFLGVLLWTFRMRQGSPYLMMDEAAADEETGGLVEGPTTELGVLSRDDGDDGGGGGGGGGGGQRSRLRLDAARFTLDEEEEGGGGGGGSGGGGLARPQPSINVHAAEQGVVVEALPTPQTPAPIALSPPPR